VNYSGLDTRNAPFCDDFDKTGETIGQDWTHDAGFYLDDGAVMTLTTTASSSPKALAVKVPNDGTRNVEAALAETIGALSNGVVVAFDLRVLSVPNNCQSGTQDLARVSSDNSTVRNPMLSVSIGFVNGTPTLYLQQTPSTPLSVPLNGTIPTNQWVRVRLAVRTMPAEAGITVHAAAYLDDAGASDEVDAQAAGSGQINALTAFPMNWASVGVLDHVYTSTSSCQVDIDNVTIY
jgi:hypothetical protein